MFLIAFSVIAQDFKGRIFEKNTNTPIEFVNIGVVGKNVGTVSNEVGNYELTIDPGFAKDTLRVSCIGYQSFSIVLSDFTKRKNHDIELTKRVYTLAEVKIRPRKYKEKTLGVSTQGRMIQAGFTKNLLGYELGILMKVKKSAIPQILRINVARTTYDTLFYRVNFYSPKDKTTFNNILETPIYIKITNLKEEMVLDLKPYNLYFEDDFMVSLEHIKDMGEGLLYFCTSLKGRTYYRKTSQGSWESVPFGVSISIDALVEK